MPYSLVIASSSIFIEWNVGKFTDITGKTNGALKHGFIRSKYDHSSKLKLNYILPVPFCFNIKAVNYYWKIKNLTRKWHSESADPAKALNLSLAKQTNKQTNEKFWPHRGSNSRP